MAVTGIEVPQLFSGMLALIRATADHYQEAAAAFSRHRMLVSEAANIASTLKIQRVIFRAANRTLLRTAWAKSWPLRCWTTEGILFGQMKALSLN